ncbi:MAG: hypothetical protein O6766_06590, partial [Gammaproteobacteria bacterium]|nr:hypothetical protein [Gammaproteobacteria bacterium]
MRISLIVILIVLACSYATAVDAADKGALQPRAALVAQGPGELRVEIHSPSTELQSTGGKISFEVEGVASTIGGVRFIDIMLV